MMLERILWIALIVVVSMAIGWILGVFYGISRMKSKEKVEDALIYEATEREKKRRGKPDIEIVTHADPRKA